MPSHNLKIGDDVFIPDLFSRHKFRVPDGENYTVDKLIDADRLQVSNDQHNIVGHYSHFAKIVAEEQIQH